MTPFKFSFISDEAKSAYVLAHSHADASNLLVDSNRLIHTCTITNNTLKFSDEFTDMVWVKTQLRNAFAAINDEVLYLKDVIFGNVYTFSSVEYCSHAGYVTTITVNLREIEDVRS